MTQTTTLVTKEKIFYQTVGLSRIQLCTDQRVCNSEKLVENIVYVSRAE